MIRKFSVLFIHEVINMITWATALHQRVQGGHPFKNLGHLDGNPTHAHKAQKLGPDH
jgi:hypothetical protein